ncbi:expressed unknown protein [Seminavis robusta]|uniref:Nuclease associated modular domain-containing protein n=1 Tax=Seminavis robusta TaxID=568900 RepID=A0A9N8DT00_9STRA|nr:expressed unknown protein [Seminavis robusta]|eukprot:Sro256_g100720.1 n/a (609) ;mRNA; f:62644-64470
MTRDRLRRRPGTTVALPTVPLSSETTTTTKIIHYYHPVTPMKHFFGALVICVISLVARTHGYVTLCNPQSSLPFIGKRHHGCHQSLKQQQQQQQQHVGVPRRHNRRNHLQMVPSSVVDGTNQTSSSAATSTAMMTHTNNDIPVATTNHNNGATSHHNNGVATNGTPLPPWLSDLVVDQNDDADTPQPTVNGGFTHTKSSRAKISAANKGKTPWNKGKGRSEEVKARIAAGVRKRNREKFLQKLADMGMTEDEYNAQEAQKKAQKDAERKARRTEKGGYRLTEETKKKISSVLKTKWANGEVKKRVIDPAKVRRGFTHSEETRAKISESLRKRWANDDDYRTNMLNKTMIANSKQDVRQRIAETLKKKWEDPVFRANMTAKMANRQKAKNKKMGMSHREKISQAIKAKWENDEYRKRATEGMAKRNAELAKARPPPKPKPTQAPARLAQPKAQKVKGVNNNSKKQSTTAAPMLMTPAKVGSVKKKVKIKKKKKQQQPKKAKPTAVVESGDSLTIAGDKEDDNKNDKKKQKKDDKKKGTKVKKRRKREKAGSVTRMREERRDLYDLLYGDDEQPEDRGSVLPSGVKSKLATLFFEDENLDDFDPYGLEEG